LLAAISLFLAWIMGKQVFYKPAWALVIIGFLLHNYGFALRIYLTERAPVSNMYETVVWVGYGTVLFGAIIEAIYRWRFILLAGSLVGAFCLILADMAPVVLDPTLQPLEPVLRNNFWLLVHVLTITISYAAFFLAFALGDIGLIYYLNDEKKHQQTIKAITLAIYRSIQIGVAFLAPGIILGGIWADYSWGRFWGWDPKETWALIALLGYLAVLHGRLSGWIKDFGMMCTGILTFSLVIMAWYGVNFVLGAGLHSYGFGAGGVEYVSIFVGLHILYVIFVTVIRNGKLKKAG
jgi:cytochrome c-type biogenesis protein CcsB